MIQNRVGKFIEKYRKEKNLTQKQLADILGVSNTAVSKWEHGNNLPDITMLAPLSEALDLDILDLINAQNSTHENTSKKIIRIRKHRTRKIIALIILFLTIIALTNFLTYNNISSKRKKDQEKAVKVYQLSSADENFLIDGYMIFNNKDSKIILEKIICKVNEQIDLDYNNIKNMNYYIKIDKQIVFSYTISLEDDDFENIHEVLDNVETISYDTTINLKDNENDFDKTTLTIQIYDSKNKSEEININLNPKQIFT